MSKLNKKQKEMLIRVLKQAIDNGEFQYCECDYNEDEIEKLELLADDLIDKLISDYDLKW